MTLKQCSLIIKSVSCSYVINVLISRGGDAATYTKSFNDIIDDLSLAYSDNDVETTRAKLITSIKCFLSDQCATNAVFNENFEKLRKDLLPKIVENFDNLSENEKKNNFGDG